MIDANEIARKLVQNQLKIVVAQFSAAYEALVQSEDQFLGKEDMLDPYLDLLEQIQLTAEYYFAEEMTNLEAFRAVCNMAGVPIVSIADKQHIPKLQAKDVNILNIHANVLGLTIKDVKTKVIELMDRVAPTGLNRQTIVAFTDSLARQYRLNSYHNFSHCLSVCQIFYYMWSVSPGIQKVINVDDMYIGCIASLCHDLGHRKIDSSSRPQQRVPLQDEPFLLAAVLEQERLGARPRLLGTPDYQAQSECLGMLRQKGRTP